MHVCVISHMYPNPVNPMSGIFVNSEVKALAEAGCRLKVFSPIPYFPLYPKWRGYRQMALQAIRDGISVQYVPTWMFPKGLFFSTYGKLYMQSLAQRIEVSHQQDPFDVIHCHTVFPDGWVGGKLAEKLEIPVVSTVHGSDLLLYPLRSQFIFQQTKIALLKNDLILTVSHRLEREAKKIAPQVSVQTLYNGFDPSLFFPQSQNEVRRKLGLSTNSKGILFVGNLLPVKGIDLLLKSFQIVHQKDSDVQLHLVGDGPLRKTLENLCQQLGIKERVFFHGRKPYSEIPLWINSADVVVLSSYSEGLPSILLESMGCGKVMVATDVGGIGEILIHKRTGLLVPSGDHQSLADSLKQVLFNHKESQQMAHQAWIESKELTWQNHAESLRRYYQQLQKSS
ncbi:glycosyltransferase family 4 protein [Hazenella coriacea]|uniref:Glycosyltransferase involved in cell wall biosynthesis n=1 Tax=Hazenella coriacea TaxID=1179467 RepID=A0A4R3L7V1_9BACL|nr:glycosyltransferase family 4 protein [Hazenella coriacea]TCS95622.1 glycosyltransferase involved in cell wall biosynthesis [Hazenella coriacea]